MKPRVINGWQINKSTIPARYNLTWEANKYLPKKYQRPKIKIVGWKEVLAFIKTFK